MFQTKDYNTGRIKYVARSKAVVVDNVDPENRGRIKVKHPTFGESNWIPYLMPANTFTVPTVGSIVYIESEAGYETNLVAMGSVERVKSDGEPNIPETFARNSPTNTGMYTLGEHLFELDDGDGPLKIGKGIRLTSSGGNELIMNDDPLQVSTDIKLVSKIGNEIEIGSLGFRFEDYFGSKIETTATDINVEHTTGNKINLKPTGITVEDLLGSSYKSSATGIELIDLFGNTISLAATGITIQDLTGNSISTSPTGIEVTDVTGNTATFSPTGVVIETSLGSKLCMENGKIDLGNAVVTIVEALDTIITEVLSATYGTSVGPTSPMLPPAAVNLTLLKTKLALLKC